MWWYHRSSTPTGPLPKKDQRTVIIFMLLDFDRAEMKSEKSSSRADKEAGKSTRRKMPPLENAFDQEPPGNAD